MAKHWQQRSNQRAEYCVRVCGFTFRFRSVEQMRETLVWFETKVHPSTRLPDSKWLRAEPVAALYEQGRVVHAGHFPALEDQMCDFGPDGLSSGRSPDRLDALVWALTELVLNRRGEPGVRQL